MLSKDHEQITREIKSLKQRLSELERRIDYDSDDDMLPSGDFSILVVGVGTERFGLMLQHVEEVIMMCRMSSLPESPEWFAGLLNLRGTSVPVIDVLARLHHKASTLNINNHIVICNENEKRIGLVVRDIHNIVNRGTIPLHRPDKSIPHAAYVLRVLYLENRTILLTSVGKLLDLMSSITVDK